MKRWEDYSARNRERFVEWLSTFGGGITKAAAKRLAGLRSGSDIAQELDPASDVGPMPLAQWAAPRVGPGGELEYPLTPAPYVKHQPETTGRTVAKGRR